MADINEIKKYWDEQAMKCGGQANATTQDIYMRNVEINYITDFLSSFRNSVKVLDIGCGNGYSTIEYKRNVNRHNYIGGDYSEEMIRAANNELENLIKDDSNFSSNIKFEVSDVLKLSEYGEEYDVIISDRCLINLGNNAYKRRAFNEIADCIRPGGYYLMIENFIEGHMEFNRLREYIGLNEIPVRWHNSFFSKNELEDLIRHKFEIESFENISSLYYLATRVIYSKMCEFEGREPDYEHLIYKIASMLPPQGNYGPICACKLIRK